MFSLAYSQHHEKNFGPARARGRGVCAVWVKPNVVWVYFSRDVTEIYIVRCSHLLRDSYQGINCGPCHVWRPGLIGRHKKREPLPTSDFQGIGPICIGYG